MNSNKKPFRFVVNDSTLNLKIGLFLELYLGGEKKKFGVYRDAKEKPGDVEENT